MSSLRTPEAAIGEARPAHDATPASPLLHRIHDRRAALRTIAAASVALGVGSATLATAGAQEAPPQGGPGDNPDGSDTTDSTESTDTTTDTGTETTDTTTTESTTTDSVSAASGSGSGQAIADFAQQFVGLPYSAAGRDPSTGFDCSGFTWYVVSNVLGIDIGGSPEGQVGYGSPVEYGAWQPGDLVFFANTFREGISHVGIAIGGSQMVHAENESTGVTISDITSDYYTSHYSSASRLA